MTKSKRRVYRNLGTCPNCDSVHINVFHEGVTGYFTEGDDVECQTCGHEGTMVDMYDANRHSYIGVKWEKVDEENTL